MLRALPLLIAGLLAGGYQPPRIVSGGTGEAPYGAAVAGLVVLQANIDARGAVRGVGMIKDLDPFGASLRDAVSEWRFEPARADGRSVEASVLVVGVFRPAMLMFPAPPIPSGPPADAPHGVPYPTDIAIPAYPPNAVGTAHVLVETDIDAAGGVTSAAVVGDSSGFDSAALESARGWSFRPARRDGADVSARAYLLFLFRQPN